MRASVLGWIMALWVGNVGPASPLELLGRLDPDVLPEASGIVKSRRYEGIFWTHNDSGNGPSLFAIRRDGTVVRRFTVAAINLDWEDIAIDDEGHLYLGDIGNNNGRLPARAIHQLQEPDPTKPPEGPLKVQRSTIYTFPAGGRFDAESLAIDGTHALLVAKTFDRRDARLFAIPLDRSNPARAIVPTPVGTLPGFSEPATGADLSADGQWLAVCSETATRVYRREKPADKSALNADDLDRIRANPWRLAAEVDYPACAAEAICWDGQDLILAGEDQRLSRIPGSIWKARSAIQAPATTPARRRQPAAPVFDRPAPTPSH